MRTPALTHALLTLLLPAMALAQAPSSPLVPDELGLSRIGSSGFTAAPKTVQVPSPLSLEANLNVMPYGIYPYDLVLFDGKLYFSGFDPETGQEVFRLEENQPVNVFDVVPGPSPSHARYLTPLGSKLVFSAGNSSDNRDLYVYDGIKTTRLTDFASAPETGINDQALALSGSKFPQVNGKVYFTATTEKQLFAYDGYSVSAVGSGLSDVASLLVYGDELLLFKQNGADATMYRLGDGGLDILYSFPNSSGSSQGILLNDRLIFIAPEGNEDHLYSYDGSAVTPIVPRSTDNWFTGPRSLAVAGGKVYFVAQTGSSQTGIFAYDLTSIKLVSVVGGARAPVHWLTGFGDRVFFFLASESVVGMDLYVLESGIVRAWSEIDATAFNPFMLYPVGEVLLATAYSEAQGIQIWAIGDNESLRVTSTSATSMSSNPLSLIAIGDDLYFWAVASPDEMGLYRYDGSATEFLVPLGNYLQYWPISQMLEFGEKLFFTVQLGNGKKDLYAYDGTQAIRIKSSTSSDMIVFDGKLYFGVEEGGGRLRLHVYDQAGVRPAPENLDPRPSLYRFATVFGPHLYYWGYQAGAVQLFAYDGSASSRPAGFNTVAPTEMVTHNGNLFYTGSDGLTTRLYRFDGTASTAIPGTKTEYCLNKCMASSADGLYFTGIADGKRELFRWCSPNVVQLTSGNAPGGTQPAEITVSGHKVFFKGLDAAAGRELFLFDGVRSGLIADIYPGPADSNPSFLSALNGKVFFSASEPYVGAELWSVDVGLASDAEETAPAPALTLDQGYPNPARAEVTVTFGLPDASRVRLAVYDLLGRKVLTISDGLYGSGRHTAQFLVADMQSGIYFIRMEACGRSLTRKMIIAR